MAFYKGDKNIFFQVLVQQGNEQFEIWKAWKLKDTPLIDPTTQQEMKFPIRDGQLTGSDGVPRNIDELKYMKSKEFTELYPWYSKKTSFIWEALIDGQQYALNLSMTANKQLEDKMNTARAMGIDPLIQIYKQIFDKTKPAQDMYKIEIMQGQGVQAIQQYQQQEPVAPQPPVQNAYAGVQLDQPPQTQPVQQAPPAQPQMTTFRTPNLDSMEQQFLTEVKEKFQGEQKLNSIQFADLCKKNGIDKSKATEMFVNDYE